MMMLLGVGTKIFGFLREMLIAEKYGSNVETDTFFIALTAITLFTIILTQSLNTTMIPILSDVENNEGKQGKIHHTNNILNIVISISIAFTVFGYYFAPSIVKLIAPGFLGEQFHLAVILMRIGIPAVVFSGIVGIYRGFLQNESMFIETALSQFPFNFVYIIFLLFLTPYFDIRALMVVNVVAVFSQILMQVPGIKKIGYFYEFRMNYRSPYIRKTLFMVLPVLMSVAVNDLNKIIDRSLASTLAEGSISSLSYSATLNGLVLIVFISAIVTVLFPMLSKEAMLDSYFEFNKLVRKGVNVILMITIPTTVGMLILAEPIVKVIYQRGAFDFSATLMTAQSLVFYSLGLTGMALRTYLERAFYSLQNTKIPMINGFLTVGLNIILNLLLIGPLQHRGLALATSIAATLSVYYLFRSLKKLTGSLESRPIISCALKSMMSSAVMGICLYFIYNFLISRLVGNVFVSSGILLLSITLSAAIYLAILYLLKVEEMIWFINLFKKKLKREGNGRNVS